MARFLVDSQIYAGEVQLDGKQIIIKDFQIAIPDKINPTFGRFLTEAGAAKLLQRTFNARFSMDGDDILIDINRVKVVYYPGSLGTFAEVFYNDTYGFNTTEQPLVVLDIGMNVGYSSLYFATMPNVERVISFEPFRESFDYAARNFALNPSAAGKITANHYGLAGSDQTLEADYSPELNVCARIGQYPANDYEEHTMSKETVVLRDASEVLNEVIERYPKHRIVAKIDCEGSEYDILRSWEENGLLSRISSYMIEWHDQGRDPLIERLTRNGFTVFSSHPYDRSFAILFATKSSAGGD